jgi:hypothetical protein
VIPAEPVVTNARAFYTPRAAAGAVGTRRFLRPLFRGTNFLHNSGAWCREKANLRLPYCERSEATTQSTLSSRLRGLRRFARNDAENGSRPGCLTTESEIEVAPAEASAKANGAPGRQSLSIITI